MKAKTRAGRNRTITLSDAVREELCPFITSADDFTPSMMDVTVLGDSLKVASKIQPGSVDLLFLDPPYNLSKKFGDTRFVERNIDSYTIWISSVIDAFLPTLKANGTVYVCGDWKTSLSIMKAVSSRLVVRNRITWEREKGRGALSNWKNASEDVWFCTVGDEYIFNVENVKVRRNVIAPYRTASGAPKDWVASEDGNVRDTFPSNLWTDITIPFWSMPENTDHPTQKSEKFMAKLLLASTNPGDVVLDPFLGSGTTSVVARKLGRRFIGIEAEKEYALLAAHRLKLAQSSNSIQGFSDGVFWERNSGNSQRTKAPEKTLSEDRLL